MVASHWSSLSVKNGWGHGSDTITKTPYLKASLFCDNSNQIQSASYQTFSPKRIDKSGKIWI